LLDGQYGNVGLEYYSYLENWRSGSVLFPQIALSGSAVKVLGIKGKCLLISFYPLMEWDRNCFPAGSTALFVNVTGLGICKFLIFEANHAIRQDSGNLARFQQSGKIMATFNSSFHAWTEELMIL
jgi:hypothetical protein